MPFSIDLSQVRASASGSARVSQTLAGVDLFKLIHDIGDAFDADSRASIAAGHAAEHARKFITGSVADAAAFAQDLSDASAAHQQVDSEASTRLAGSPITGSPVG